VRLQQVRRVLPVRLEDPESGRVLLRPDLRLRPGVRLRGIVRLREPSIRVQEVKAVR
jgi:hypothetical protein